MPFRAEARRHDITKAPLHYITISPAIRAGIYSWRGLGWPNYSHGSMKTQSLWFYHSVSCSSACSVPLPKLHPALVLWIMTYTDSCCNRRVLQHAAAFIGKFMFLFYYFHLDRNDHRNTRMSCLFCRKHNIHYMVKKQTKKHYFLFHSDICLATNYSCAFC